MMHDVQVQESKQEGAAATSKPRWGAGTFSSLAYRDYRYLWIGMLFSSGGQWIQQISLSWLVYDMTHDAFLLGVVNGVRALPFLISGPFAGVAADRMDRKKLMFATQMFIMVTAVLMGILIQTGLVQVWHIILFSLLTGVAWSFNQPVRQALMPNIVPPEALMNAIALSSAAFQMTRIVGPTVAGLLVGVIGVSGNFYLQGLAYLGVAVTILLMNVPPIPAKAKQASVFGDLAEGLRYVYRHEILLTLVIMALVPMILYMPYMTLMPVFAGEEVFNIGPEGLGLLMTAPGFGALACTLIIASLGNFKRKGILQLGAGLATGISLIAFGASGWLPLTLIILVLVGGTGMVFFAVNNTIVQQMIPDELRGRVMAIYMLDMGLSPLGALLAGAMASQIGAPLTIEILGAAMLLLSAAVLIAMPRLRRLE